MRLALQIALRYFFSRKSHNVVNVISWISVVGILVGTTGIIIVLSVFNGLHGLIGTLYSHFDPDFKIEPERGKVFVVDEVLYDKLIAIDGVESATMVLEEHVLFRFGKRQVPGRILGVCDQFTSVSQIDTIIVEGSFRLEQNGMPEAVVGYALADRLAMRINFVTPLMIYAPERQGRINPARPEQAFRSQYAQPAGFFMVNQMEYDADYALIGLSQAQSLFSYDADVVSWVGVKVKSGYSMSQVRHRIEELMGPEFRLRNREQQHETFYRMMRVEKFVAYLILSFILVIAVFNVIGSLSMLIFEKRYSIVTLRSMGAPRSLINMIFVFEGWLISLVGLFGGLILGVALVGLQQTFGLLQFQGGGSFVVDAYPVILRWADVLAVFITVSCIGLFAAWYPVRVIVKRYYTHSIGL